MKNSKSLLNMSFNYKDIVAKSVSGIQEELVQEQVEMVRDYIKAAFRMKFDLEKEIKKSQDKIKSIEAAVDKTNDGSLTEIKALQVPARYLSEKTARLSNLDWDQE